MSSRFKIPAHVFFYSLALAPGCFYAYYYDRNKPKDEELEEVLRERYSHNINSSSSKRSEMHQFVEAMKAGKSNEKMDEVLHAGKGTMKRHYRVDDRYYGKEEGVRVKDQIVEEKKRKKQHQEENQLQHNSSSDEQSSSSSSKTTSVVALAVVSAAAAVLGMFLGDRRK